MRFFLLAFPIMAMMSGTAIAQSDPIYNSSGYAERGSTTLYNTQSSRSGVGGPLSIKNMVRQAKQKPNTIMGETTKTYNPYSLGGDRNGNGYALSMTPAEVRAKQALDRQRALERERDRQKRLAETQAKREADRRLRQETNSYTSRFQDSSQPSSNNQGVQQSNVYSSPTTTTRKRRSVYRQNSDALSTPQKVFGNVY